jgi:2-methylisocitrate lyase-like PEP mutase family enzyme
VSAAAEAAHAGGSHFVLTARTENYLHGAPDLDDTIARLQAFQGAGADVLYAPGVTAPADISAIVSALDRPVNVLLMPAGPDVATLAALGVRRISVGGAFAYTALGALAEAAQELREQGTGGFFERSAQGRETARAAFR